MPAIRCTKCGDTNADNFYDSKKRPGTMCRTCCLAYAREWKRNQQATEPEKVRAYRRDYGRRNRDRLNAMQRQWRIDNPEKIAARLAANRDKAAAQGRYAYYRHGVTLEQRRAIEADQGGLCAICGIELSTTPRPSIDHDHATGAIRGILCNKCNASLGWFEARSDAILQYLDKLPVHPGKQRK